MSHLDIYGDTKRIQAIFNWFTSLILASLAGGVAIMLVTEINPRTLGTAAITALTALPVMANYILIKRRQYTWAALILALILITMITVVATRGLGIHHISVLGYPTVLIVASLVTNKRSMVFLTLYTIACIAWLVFGELSGAFTPTTLVRSVPGDFFTTAMIVGVTAIFVRMLSETLFNSNLRLKNELIERKMIEAKLEKDIALRLEAEEQVRRLNAELEQRVSQRTEQLEAANQELQSFSYSVSHDLRSPLRSLDGYSRLLLEEYGECLEGEGKQYLSNILISTRHMSELIDGLLKLSRVTRAELSLTTIDLSSLAENILAGFRRQEADRQVETLIQPGMSAGGDLPLLRVALENLLGNAWKFTRKQPQARIEFCRAPSAEGEPQHTFMIRDNGVGFNPAYRNKLFTPFQRLHHKDEFEGAGIGLTTVQRILQRHGGKIWVEAKEGQGATFYFTLPGE